GSSRPAWISSCTRSLTGATPCPTPAPATWPGSTAPQVCGWDRSWAATGPWIATGAGSAPSVPMTCSSTAMPLTAPPAAREPSGMPTSEVRPTSSSNLRSLATRRASERKTECCASTFAPTACGRSSGPWPSPASVARGPEGQAGSSFKSADYEQAEQLPGWDGRGGAAPVSALATLTEYEEGWPYPVVFAPERPQITLSEVIARSGAKQLHVAETEKYPHVTYFFNGGEETPCTGERRELVPSPRDVPTYDQKPQMSAREATAAFVGAWREDGADGLRFGVINFANADMVGHTGVIPAAVAAIETVDGCLGEVVEAVCESGGVCVVTADHGNADHMLEPDGSPNTAHSLNPVTLVVTAPGLELRVEGGILADVAPTVLDLLGMEQPAQMTGKSLIEG